MPSKNEAPPAPLVLFLCQSNTASSIMAEAILDHLARGRVRAASGGNAAGRQVNSFGLECLRNHGVATRALRSKPWGELFGLFKPPVHFLISLAAVDAAEADWSHDNVHPVKANWGMPDPSAVTGSDVDVRRAFDEAFRILDARIRRFLALPLERMTDEDLSRELALIGEELQEPG